MGLKQELRDALEEGRQRTFDLTAGLSDADLGEAACGYLSPPVWDMGHIANFEELWLVQNILDCPEMHDGYNDIYDAFRHPRAERPKLRLLNRDGARDYMDEVRGRALRVLDEVDLQGDCGRLLKDGFVHRMIIQHEAQHQETLIQSLMMHGPRRYRTPPARDLPGPTPPKQPSWIDVPQGSFTMGTDPAPGVYDNESPSHDVDVAAFQIARDPVTCGDYLAFMEAGGYQDEALWSKRGRAWLADEAHHAPLHWKRRDDGWWRVDLRGARPVADVADEVLAHVTYFEAEAFASWSDARLPTEAEWEKAARWSPDGTQPRSEPSPEAANVDQTAFGCSRVGAARWTSPLGARHMLGDVWEWTSSEFEAYPGFEAYPYDEYSKVFFGGDYRVLRGGSWATRPGCATATFRNWDHPYRRQIVSGIRLARSAKPTLE